MTASIYPQIFSHRRIYLGQCQGGWEGYPENTGNIVGPHPEWDVTGHHAHTHINTVYRTYQQFIIVSIPSCIINLHTDNKPTSGSNLGNQKQ